MLRVRPGVELVRASFLPTSVLMTLDLPTFERPRKAISGRLGRGKCVTSLADNMYRDKIRMGTVSVFGWQLARVWEKKLARCDLWRGCRGGWLQAERAFIFDFDVFDWMQAVPESEAAGDDESDEDADEEEETVCGQSDEEEGDDGDSSD